jgi:hypothetical protein
MKHTLMYSFSPLSLENAYSIRTQRLQAEEGRRQHRKPQTTQTTVTSTYCLCVSCLVSSVLSRHLLISLWRRKEIEIVKHRTAQQNLFPALTIVIDNRNSIASLGHLFFCEGRSYINAGSFFPAVYPQNVRI